MCIRPPRPWPANRASPSIRRLTMIVRMLPPGPQLTCSDATCCELRNLNEVESAWWIEADVAPRPDAVVQLPRGTEQPALMTDARGCTEMWCNKKP